MKTNQQNKFSDKNSVLFTTSWDDGHILDIRVAEMLERYNLQGTFYVNQYRGDNNFLAPERIRELSSRFEIGAHTLTHPDLTKLNEQNLQEEIQGSKKYLEDILGKEVLMFCYPKGLYSEMVKRYVASAGFLGARTVVKYVFARPEDPFAMGTTVHAYPWPLRKKDAEHYLLGRHLFQPVEHDFGKFLKTAPPLRAFISWQAYARHLFDYALSHGDYFHLWGHSWEIEKYGMWEELDEFFRYASARLRDGVISVSNSEIVKVDNG
ncbi:polysaccharide deacetylase family protein [Patescibacteria group bacterium]|nr:polysaccharide deacetylase family protein [Patescibacteria group bacterium]